ncbi:MAG: 50S ribosomal protein L6 [Deltaproteobacteria bacterium]|nr:MAG: 50S ribosomal protein L6 [Deltaproteobacteria bacterium]
MSRIGNQPLELPAGVTLEVADGEVRVKGPKGQLTQALVPSVAVQVDGNNVTVERAGNGKQARAYHGLMRSLIGNMVEGVTSGFEKKLEIIGVGYRADVRGSNLVLNLGYSHPIEYAIPAGIEIAVDKSTKVSIKGIDKQKVGQVAADIRAYRRPDSYKGKGVRYEGEHISLKAGKSA